MLDLCHAGYHRDRTPELGRLGEPVTLLYREDDRTGGQLSQDRGYDAMRKPETPAPKWVFMLGAQYTPQEFARSVCKPGEYIALMSDDSKPYYETSELDVPDNWTHEQYLNIPMDSLLVRTERSVSAHHGVCWEDKNHAMAIVGLAHDEDGEQYFIMKNSWGDS